MQPYPIEALLEAIEGIERAAVITSENTPDGIVILQAAQDISQGQLISNAQQVLADLGLDAMPACTIAAVPVDGRHNSKVDRPLLRKQVEENFQPGASRI